MANITARAEIDVAAPAGRVWSALTDPALISKYLFGSIVETDWKPGSPIVWRGEYQGKPYEDRGEVLEVEPNRRLRVTHYSPASGKPDTPENRHTVLYELDERDGTTHVRLEQDNNHDEAEAQRATENWRMTLDGLKRVVEQG